ncbi:MAG: hypothetical protein HY862_19845 [Chloroflexi bacterium]|nr:hypothetical protein [Chloroflexota bacterium]
MKKFLVLALLLTSGLGVFPIQTSQAQQSEPANWTIMHYTDVDNNLEGAAFNDYYEMQSAGSMDGVTIVAQLDRAEGFDTRFGDWTDTRRFVMEYVPQAEPADAKGERAAVVEFLVARGAGTVEDLTAQAENTPDETIHRLYTENNLGVTFDQTPVEDLGEVDMGDPQSLVDFIEWSVQNYPAEHYMLVIGSHGGGWRGIGPDDGLGQESMLELPEIDAALATARADLGIDKFDIVGFDACLMAVTDVAVMLEPHADYVLFSQEVIPSNGWEYYHSITAMQQHPEWDAFQVGSTFVDSYMDYYGGVGARTKVGLSLVETAGLPDLLATLEDFAAVVGSDTAELLSALGTARNNSQAFATSLSSRGEYYSYIDLRDFMNWFSLQTSITEDAYSAALAVIAAYDNTVIYSRADSHLPGATGLAVYLPAQADSYDTTYPAAAPSSFAFWQAYLDQFYQTISTELDGSALSLDIKNVFTLGESGSSVDNPVIFFDAAGVGVVDITYSILYVQEDGSRILVDTAPIAYTTTLPTGETVTEYPNELTPSTFNWSVEFPYLTDGTNSLLSVASTSGNQLSISGTYVTAQGRQPAALLFDAGTYTFLGMLASNGESVYEPVPTPGDQFIVDMVIISPDGEIVVQPQEDTPLTFGLEPFTFGYKPAISGSYVIGLSITDLAGNTVRKWADLSINNEGIDGTLRSYTDTNEGVYFQYPYAWGEMYSLSNDDGSLTNALSDPNGTQSLFVDVYLETDALSALEANLANIEGDVSEIQETTFAGLPAYEAFYTVTTDDGTATTIVISVLNEQAGSVVVFSFSAWGDGVQPDTSVIDLLDNTIYFFPPILE